MDILAQMHELGISSSETITAIEIDGLNRIIHLYEKTEDVERDPIFSAFNSYDASTINKSKVIHDNGIWELAKFYNVKFSQEEVEVILSRYYNEDSKKTEPDARKALLRIRHIMNNLETEQSRILDMVETDCLERICGNYQNANEEECNEIIKKINDFEALEKNKTSFLDKIKIKIENIWSKEDGLIFDEVYLNTDIHNQEEIKKAIEFVKEKGRTADSQKYIYALSNCTEDNIIKARKYLLPSTKRFVCLGFVVVIIGAIFLLAGLGVLLSMAITGAGIGILSRYYGFKKYYNILTINGTIKHKMIFGEEIHDVVLIPRDKNEKTANANGGNETEHKK